MFKNRNCVESFFVLKPFPVKRCNETWCGQSLKCTTLQNRKRSCLKRNFTTSSWCLSCWKFFMSTANLQNSERIKWDTWNYNFCAACVTNGKLVLTRNFIMFHPFHHIQAHMVVKRSFHIYPKVKQVALPVFWLTSPSHTIGTSWSTNAYMSRLPQITGSSCLISQRLRQNACLPLEFIRLSKSVCSLFFPSLSNCELSMATHIYYDIIMHVCCL